MQMTTNNLFSNLMITGTLRVQPEVGMGATLCYYTDREAATVIKVENLRGKIYVTVQEDHADRTDNYGMSDMQEYKYYPNPDGRTYTYRFNEKKSSWDRVTRNEETGRWNKADSPHLALGIRRKYYDYSF